VPVTREFLLKLIDVLLEFVRQTNDRNCKVLDFHHPADMRRLMDLELPDTPSTLQQLIDDCCITLKYQVKTGECRTPPPQYASACTKFYSLAFFSFFSSLGWDETESTLKIHH
jgi:hypothetical protein